MVNTTSFGKTWTLYPCHEHYEHIPKFVLFQLWKVLTPSPPPSGSTTTPRVAGAGSSACAPCWSRWAVVGGELVTWPDAHLWLVTHQVLTTGIQLSFGVLYIHILRSREFGLDTKEDFMSAGRSLICNLDKYKSTPCSILPLFPSPEDISWK